MASRTARWAFQNTTVKEVERSPEDFEAWLAMDDVEEKDEDQKDQARDMLGSKDLRERTSK